MNAGELADLARPLVDAEGFELVECTISRLQRSQIFRVFIDREGGVPIESCARVSRRISSDLDANPLLQGSYKIEVSSPGMSRPIWKLRHFERFEGEQVRVDLADPAAEPKVLLGEIGPVEKDGFWLRLENGETRHLQLGQIEKARLRMDPWKRKLRGGRSADHTDSAREVEE